MPGTARQTVMEVPNQDAQAIDPGNPRRFLRSIVWTMAMQGFVHGKLPRAAGTAPADAVAVYVERPVGPLLDRRALDLLASGAERDDARVEAVARSAGGQAGEQCGRRQGREDDGAHRVMRS